VPRAFYLTKAIAWGHQHQLPGNRERHVVEFIFVGGTDGK
jgi:hypothetical protein